MNIASNPWSLISTDVVSSAITSLTLQTDGSVVAVIGSTTGFAVGNFVTVADNTSSSGIWNWLYKIAAVTNSTTLKLFPSPYPSPGRIPAGTAAAGATGTLSLCVYTAQIRVEDISWQNPSAQGQLLDLRNSKGQPVWKATATGAGSQNRGKIFWIDGLTPVTIQSGIVLLTVN